MTIFESHREKIYPWVKVIFGNDDPRNTSVQFEFKGQDLPVHKNWISDLSIFYVVDTGESFQMLLKRDLPVDIIEEQLDQIARENLNRDFEYELRDANFGGHMLTA